MDRRQFLHTSGVTALGAAVSDLVSAQAPPTVLPPDRAALARPQGLITVLCAVSRNTTLIDYVGPEAVFEAWFPKAGATRPEKHFQIFTVAESKEPISGIVPDHTFGTAPAANVVVVPAQIGSPALHEWLRGVNKKTAAATAPSWPGRALASKPPARVYAARCE